MFTLGWLIVFLCLLAVYPLFYVCVCFCCVYFVFGVSYFVVLFLVCFVVVGMYIFVYLLFGCGVCILFVIPPHADKTLNMTPEAAFSACKN